jgi:uncharacterized protein
MAQRRPAPRGSRSGGGWLFLLGLLVGAGVLYLLFLKGSPPRPAPSREGGPSARRERLRQESAGRRRTVASDHVEPTPVATIPAASGPVHGVRVALVVDDLGGSVGELQPLEELGVPVTYSVLPFAEETPQVVSELRQRRAEILLHLPMEPKNGEDPGPGALLQGMTDEELREKTLAALQAVPGAVGVNNHMGSLLSAAEGPMTAVLGVLAARGLFFLDSRTSAQSVGFEVARRLGIPAAERQVFLDGDPAPEAIRGQFERLLGLARVHGAAIAIGHPHPDTLAVLTAEVPRARALGYEFVPVSYLLTRSGGE